MLKAANKIEETWVSDGGTMARTLARLYRAAAILEEDCLGQRKYSYVYSPGRKEGMFRDKPGKNSHLYSLWYNCMTVSKSLQMYDSDSMFPHL